MIPRHLLLPALLLLALPAFPLFAMSPADSMSQTPVRLATKNGISLDQATAIVRKETGGRVLSADRQSRNGQTIYRIKVLMPSGVVKVVRVDAATGEMN
jgi:uncharacterized membrane protein YkoI